MHADQAFKQLHQPGNPLILYNVWDAGSAVAVATAGAGAIATGSLSVAGALGYPDGEVLPLETLLWVAARIVAVTELPLSIDFEAGYGDTPKQVAENALRLQELGVAGINLEDGIPPEKDIRPASEQADRLNAIRKNTRLFINARTDFFLQNPPDTHAKLLPSALERAKIYHDAGADGFFAPGLVDEGLIGDLCRDCPLPVNIMALPSAPPISKLAALNVARVSFGPSPWRAAMAALTEAAAQHYQPRA